MSSRVTGEAAGKRLRKMSTKRRPPGSEYLMMNRNFVCFDCRTNARAHMGNPICPKCRKEMTGLGCRIELPLKSNVRAWKKLAELHRP